MEYGSMICEANLCDANYTRYVGYQETNDCIRRYYSPENVAMISKKVTELLQGVDPNNRPIIVPNKTICNIMDSVYYSFRPPTGDIYGRYNVPTGMGPEDYVQSMIDQTIEIITNTVRNEMMMEENNRKLTAWTTVYGDFNQHGLRAHPEIKILKKRPTPFQFQMHY